jgi:ABC-type Fe3+/spermidine/putrescine transport system ATPase subunit
MPSLRLVNVTKRFGSQKALDDVTFEVKDREYLCILGSTGSGKTTLLRSIAGIIRPDEGEVYIDGEKVNSVPAEERNAVYVPQTYALFPHMTILDNVTFGPLAKGADRATAEETALRVLKLVRLDKRADGYPNELSGGMQQRVSLARGLASGAKLLLLDEPLGALDVRLRLELRTELRKLAKESGLTVIHVTHDQEEAMAIGDRLLVLRRGHLQQISTPYHVYNRPEKIFVANFVGNTTFLEATVAERSREGSTLRLREDLRIRVSDSSFEPEEAVIVGIREENTTITPEPRGDEPNRLSGEVTEVHFLGGFTRYVVRLANGDEIAARIPIRDAKTEINEGDWVSLSFDPLKTHVYEYPTLGLPGELEAS